MLLQTLNRYWRLLLVLFSLLGLAACISEDGPGSAPANFQVVPGDGRVTVTWDEEPGLTYWVFGARAAAITPDNYRSFPDWLLRWPARSGLVIAGLKNGETYAFTINATNDGSPAGPSAPSTAVVPRLAGNSWLAGGAAGSNAFNALIPLSGMVLAAGDGGAIYTSPLGDAWTQRVSGTTANLRAALFDGSRLLVVGDGGLARFSADFLADAPSWTATSTGISTRLNSLVYYGGSYVAVGDGGEILSGVLTTDSSTSPATYNISWTRRSSGTTAQLNKVVWLKDRFVALGNGGTLLSSSDGISWTTLSSGSSANLNDTGQVTLDTVTSYLVVGDAGTVLRSTDLSSWTADSSGTTAKLTAIASGSRVFIAGEAGALLYGSGDGSWTPGSTGLGQDVHDLLAASGGFVAVGPAGSSAYAY